jgi:hypothetical protein
MELITYSHILLSIGFLFLTTIIDFLIFNSEKYAEAMLFKSQGKSNKKVETYSSYINLSKFVTYVDQPAS